MAEARAVREARAGRLVTYSPKVFIPLTKLCRDVCHYCTFAQPPRRGERAFMTIDEVLEVARAGRARRLPRGAVHARRQAGAALPRRARGARGARVRRRRSSTSRAAARAVLEETVAAAAPQSGRAHGGRTSRCCGRSSASMGMMLETTSDRLSARGGPHFGSPDKLPAARLETLRLAGEARVPFTTGILIGIGETREERLEALQAIARAAGPARAGGDRPELPRQAGHADGDAPEPPLEELLWTIARRAADPAAGGRGAGAAEPDRATSPGCSTPGSTTGAASRRSRSTTSTPRRRGPSSSCCAPRPRAAGLELAPRLTVYPRLPRRASGSTRPSSRTCCAPPTRSASPARTTGRPARPATCRSSSRRDPLPARLAATSSARTRSCACSAARGEERQRVFAAADALRREVNGDVVTYVVTRNIQYTNVCYFRCGFCAFSKGKLAANLRGEPYLVPHEEIVRRAVEAWERGATEVCLQGGIHPAFDGDYYASVVRAIKDAVPELHVHAFSALEVWQGAATLGVPLATYLDAAARRGPRLAAGHRGRGARRRGARGHLPRQDHDRAVARGARDRARASACARTTRSCSATSTGRGTGRATCSRCASCSGGRAASPSSCRCRSCTWRRRST